jgi:hypothetical protein
MGYFVERQKPVDIEFEGQQFPAAFRIDLLVDRRLVVEIKCADALNNAAFEAAADLSATDKAARGATDQFCWSDSEGGTEARRQRVRPLRVSA